MSYHKSRAVTRYRKAPVSGLGGILESLFSSPIDLLWGAGQSCTPSDTLTKFRASADALKSTWNPTGVYTWNDIADMTAAVAQLSSQASSMAISFFAGASSPSSKDKVRAAAAKYNSVAKQALDYDATWKAAKAKNVPISAPGFKQWVIDDLDAALVLMRTVELEVCQSPWWVATLAVVGEFFNTVLEVAKRIAGVTAALAQNALKAIERTGTLLSYAPYIALGVGALYLWSLRKRFS